MPTYRVLRSIEHNQKLYLPEIPDALPSVKSAGNGQDIAVEASGMIDLREEEAAALADGQIELDNSGKPRPIERTTVARTTKRETKEEKK